MASGNRFPTLRIVQPRGWGARILGSVLILAALAAGAWTAFQYGSSLREGDVTQLTNAVAGLEAGIEKERQMGRELRQKLAVSERGSEMDKAAVEDARSELKELQTQKLALEKQVVFLRGLVSTVGGGILNVHDWKLQGEAQAGVYRYAFTISQLAKDFVNSEGTVEISLSGARNGQPHTLRLFEITKPPVKFLSMRFRHFQQFEGELIIPEGFSPERVVVEAKPKSEKLAPATERFDWKVESG